MTVSVQHTPDPHGRDRLPPAGPSAAAWLFALACLGVPAWPDGARAQQAAPLADQDTPGAPSTQQNPIPGPTGEGSPTRAPSPGQRGWAGNLFTPSQPTFLGDIYGLRTLLGRYGVSLGLQDVGEVSANPVGGVRRGAAYKGLTILSLGLDTGKALGWTGGTLNVSALQIRGRDLSVDNLPVLHTNSSTEAARATRLWELWFQQAVAGGRFDVRVGQQAVDQEFMGSAYAGLFINAAFGYPLVPSVAQYAGGPAYPLASLGVRLRAQPNERWTVLAGVFDDNPPGGPFLDDSQVRAASQSGTRFNTGTGALWMAEVQYGLNPPSAGPDGKPVPRGLPGTYKLGGWFDTGRFPDQRVDAAGLSLADPASTGAPRLRRRNWSLYAVADQALWRPDPTGARVLGAFVRAFGAPGDRNLATVSLNAGLTLKAPLPGRDDDTLGLGFGYGRIGPSAIQLDQVRAGGAGLYPVRSAETFAELTYQAQLAPWWAVQPSVQYFWLPGGGIPDPLRPGKRIGNAATITLRTNVTF